MNADEFAKADHWVASRSKRPDSDAMLDAARWMCIRKGLNPDAYVEFENRTMLESALDHLRDHWTKHEAMMLAGEYFSIRHKGHEG